MLTEEGAPVRSETPGSFSRVARLRGGKTNEILSRFLQLGIRPRLDKTSKADSLPSQHDPARRRAEIRAIQLDEMLRLAKFTAIPQIIIAAAYMRFFWFTPERHYVICLLIAVTIPAMAAIVAAWIWQGQSFSKAATDFGHKAAAVLALISGSAWATMPIFLFSTAHEALVTATVAGLISIVYVLGPILSASLFFVAPIVAATFCKMLAHGGSDTGSLSFLLLIYAIFTVICRTLMNMLSIQHITDRINVGEQNETIRLLLRDFEENASDWLWETDEQGRLHHVPDRLIEVSGLPVGLVGTRFEDLLSTSSSSTAVLDSFATRTAFIDALVEVGTPTASVWWKLTGKPIYGARGFVGFRGVGTDVTATRNAELRIAFLAEHDHLTGIGNRVSFQAHVVKECEAISRSGGLGALLYIDLDGFKHVNDSFGHAVGDDLLKRAAVRILEHVTGEAMAARLGGDEFAVWLPANDRSEVDAFAFKLIVALSKPFDIDERVVTVGASIGVALVPDHGTELEGLYLKADMALYRAKSEGKGRHLFFDEKIEEALIARRTMESELALGLARREFELFYQPILDLQSGRLSCFEALVRWRNASGGCMLPGDFIPVAEMCGFIVDLGRWVLQEACREASNWPEDVRVAVNVSPRQLRSPGFIQDVELALQMSGIAPARLEIEITEGLFLESAPASTETLRLLRKKGVSIAIDDFGTGFSSLSYLVKFPIDKIKIDKSFIQGLMTCSESQAVVEAILALADRLNIGVTAEGVETLDQAIELANRRCEAVQGYLLSPPRPRAEVPWMLDALPKHVAAMALHEQLDRTPTYIKRRDEASQAVYARMV